MTDEIISIIIRAARQLKEQNDIELAEDLHANSALFGDGGILDSVDLVSLVVAVEQAIEEEFGINVDLADEKALSQEHSPYQTVSALANYAVEQIGPRASAQ